MLDVLLESEVCVEMYPQESDLCLFGDCLVVNLDDRVLIPRGGSAACEKYCLCFLCLNMKVVLFCP